VCTPLSIRSATDRRSVRRVRALVALLCAGLLVACGTDSADELYRRGHFEASLAAYLEMAEAGDPRAQNRVGIQYFAGLGVARDHARAFEWFERAAYAGEPAAQRNLGLMYLMGYGVDTDVDLAFGWLDLAQQNGNQSVLPLMKRLPGKLTPNQMMRVRARLKETIAAHEAAATP